MRIKTYFEDFLSLIYPVTCVSCGNLLPKSSPYVCPSCLYHLPKTKNHVVPVPQFAHKFEGIVKVDKVYVYSYFQKQGIVQKILHELKYNDNPEIGELFGKRFANDLKTDSEIRNFDMVIPVPLHPKKLKRRGYNQSEAIAIGMSQVLSAPVKCDLLFRKRHQETQTKRSKIERIKIMRETFDVVNTKLDGKHLLLVDDVLTTGATLISCVEKLQDLNPQSISIAVLAGVK